MHSIFTAMPVAFTNGLSPWSAHVVVFCAVVLPYLVLLGTAAYLLFRPLHNHHLFAPFENLSRRAQDIGVVIFSVGLTLLAAVALKDYFQVLRPSVFNLNLHALIVESDYGFPSGHASVFAALAIALLFINRKAGKWAVFFALIIGTARIIAGVHTPLDILGGFVLGTTISFIVGIVIEHLSSPTTTIG